MVKLEHDGSLEPGDVSVFPDRWPRHLCHALPQEAYIQAALLYTTPSRQRRLRVHTVGLTVTDGPVGIFRYADIEAITNVFMRDCRCT